MIRQAKLNDTRQILELLKQVNLIHYNARPDIFNKVEKYNEEELMKKVFNEPIFVYEEEGIIKGYIFGKIIKKNDKLFKDAKTFFIDDFCVDENQRGKGIGRKLYEYVKEYAKSISCTRITLNVWAFNNSAYEFYRKLGLTDLETVMEEKLGD